MNRKPILWLARFQGPFPHKLIPPNYWTHPRLTKTLVPNYEERIQSVRVESGRGQKKFVSLSLRRIYSPPCLSWKPSKNGRRRERRFCCHILLFSPFDSKFSFRGIKKGMHVLGFVESQTNLLGNLPRGIVFQKAFSPPLSLVTYALLSPL